MRTQKLTTPPAIEPVSLDQAKRHLRVHHSDEDADIRRLIAAARRAVESRCDRALIEQTWTLYLDAFPAGRVIELPRPPGSPVAGDTTVKYYDSTNTLVTLSSGDYTVDAAAEPARLVLDEDAAWPATYDRPAAVQIACICGYGEEASDVPDSLIAAVLLELTLLYERGDMLPNEAAQVRDAADRLIALDGVETYS